MTFQKSINAGGSLVDLDTPKVMGVINVTPDSFYPGSRKNNLKSILKEAENMLLEGATFLDIGGYSSRPGAVDITVEEEIGRIAGPIEEIAAEFPKVIISVDTFRSSVAKEAVQCGATMVNDISSGSLDSDMLMTVGKLGVPYIGMHMRGTPQTMVKETDYQDLLKEMIFYFSEKIALMTQAGISDILIDPGFGFAKNKEQNFYLLNRVEYLSVLDKPILVGLSRKSMIYKTLKISAENALNGTTVLNTVALLKGASILRVHDVKEAVETVKLVTALTF